jgi:hypothetical protein
MEDTLPEKYKALFFGHKSPPCMNKDFDILGFNVESIVKWNVLPMRKLFVEVFLAQLNQKYSYPKAITFFDYKRNLNMPLRNIVWDVEHGLLIKLCGGKLHGQRQVTHAISGY